MQDEKAGRGTVTITGAFSYTGKYVARLLLDRGYRVRTLTGHPGRENPLGQAVEVFPYDFDHPDQLRETLLGTSTLINTYWVRFPRGELTFETAVRNTRTLIDAAKDVGVGRIVHVSIANPSAESPLSYYRGKAAGAGRGRFRACVHDCAAYGDLWKRRHPHQ
jgi:nucleoside-diphosphate-sugar epimerase